MAEGTDRTAGEWARGSLDLMVLSTLAEGPQYGYRIQEALARASGGAVSVKAGTLYPLLHRLEAQGWVKSRWDDSTGRKRKWYRLTPAGRRRLVQQAEEWRDYAERLWQMLAPILKQSPDAWEGPP